MRHERMQRGTKTTYPVPDRRAMRRDRLEARERDEALREALQEDARNEIDCRHGCNGDCLVSGSTVCDMTCHENMILDDWGPASRDYRGER